MTLVAQSRPFGDTLWMWFWTMKAAFLPLLMEMTCLCGQEQHRHALVHILRMVNPRGNDFVCVLLNAIRISRRKWTVLYYKIHLRFMMLCHDFPSKAYFLHHAPIIRTHHQNTFSLILLSRFWYQKLCSIFAPILDTNSFVISGRASCWLERFRLCN